MKIVVYADPHWSTYSSIMRKRGKMFSVRLENLIESVSWVENLAKQVGARAIVSLGDFFDKPDLTAEEITALNRVSWNQNAMHYFLVGNHEMGSCNLDFSSTHLFDIISNAKVISAPTTMQVEIGNNAQLVFLPYILEENKKPLDYYVDKEFKGARVVFSHNDIKGVNYGAYTSTAGFSIDEIDSVCDLYLNGHLHNGEYISKKCINVGNLTGQNFSEDATVYAHRALILDTDTLEYCWADNPYAFNFYKFDNSVSEEYIGGNMNLKSNAVISAVIDEDKFESLSQKLEEDKNVQSFRIVVNRKVQEQSDIEEKSQDLTIDHIKQFTEYVLNNIGDTEDIRAELSEVCK